MVDNNRRMARGVQRQCGCNDGCESLKKRLKAVEFSLVDVVLYLDAYPDCRKALNYYSKLRKEREMLLESINNSCGPLTMYDNVSCDEWKWTDGPWPWQNGVK